MMLGWVILWWKRTRKSCSDERYRCGFVCDEPEKEVGVARLGAAVEGSCGVSLEGNSAGVGGLERRSCWPEMVRN